MKKNDIDTFYEWKKNYALHVAQTQVTFTRSLPLLLKNKITFKKDIFWRSLPKSERKEKKLDLNQKTLSFSNASPTKCAIVAHFFLTCLLLTETKATYYWLKYFKYQQYTYAFEMKKGGLLEE